VPDDFAALARITPNHPGQSTEQVAAELDRLRTEMDERFARLHDNPQQHAPLIWCVDETHAALDTPIDPELRARLDAILAKGRTVTLVPGRRP
jgi:hypothetical protein